MENSEYYNFEEVCRICLSKGIELKSIFSIYSFDRDFVKIIDFIYRVTSIKIEEGDGLPENLCTSCIETLCKIYDFSRICVASDNLLRLQRENFSMQRIKNEIVNDSTPVEANELNYTCEVKLEYEENENGLYDKDTVDVLLLTDCSDFVENSKATIEDIFIKSEETVLTKEILSESYSSSNCNNKEELPLEEETIICKKFSFCCDKCDASFSTHSMLEKHNISHDVNCTFKCDLCPKIFTTETNLVMHLHSHMNADGKPHECDICGEKFIYLYLLQRHSNKHVVKKPFPCSKCSKGCYTAESLRRHMKIHDANNIKKKHRCTVCLKEFAYPSNLTEHMKYHTGEKPFLCSLCGKGYYQAAALKYHMRTHTGCKPFKCYVCTSSFTSRTLLKAHVKRHTNERSYICDICGMAFRQLTDMKSHRRLHSGERRALCMVCGKMLSTKAQLNVHLRSHTDERPFACDVCQKAFTRRTILVKHYRIHTGEKPYQCSICHRAFSQSSSLRTHLKVHKRKELKDHDEVGANASA